MNPKLKNFKPLLDWLDAGCPHIAFSMEYSLNPLEDVEDDYDLGDYFADRDQPPPPDCGSVCCIAGFVYQSVTGDLNERYWSEIQAVAAKHLGLTQDEPTKFFEYNLFNPDLSPPHCTPAEAAAAVRRVMKGEAPWT